MKNYIRKVIHLFTTSEHHEEVTKDVHQWLLDEHYADEKEAAIHALWNETEGKVDAGTWSSLSKVFNKVGVGAKDSVKKRRIRVWQYAAAAVVVLAVSVSETFFLTKSRYAQIAIVEKFTPAGEMNTITLPDGSEVLTNSGTTLLYPETFKGDERIVYLIGEANFKVKKNPDKPFIVKSKAIEVLALGTEFNISAYPENDEVVATLIHGKIKVDCKDEMKSYLLNPSQQVAYQNHTKRSVLAVADLEDVTAWQKGLFVFRGMMLKDVLTTLERRYAITFQYNANFLNKDKYNFRFRKKSTIEDVMAIIQEVVGGFSYKIDKEICYIKPSTRK